MTHRVITCRLYNLDLECPTHVHVHSLPSVQTINNITNDNYMYAWKIDFLVCSTNVKRVSKHEHSSKIDSSVENSHPALYN